MNQGDSVMSIVPIAPGEVLVVDDDEGTRRAILAQLSGLGLHVTQAESGERAVTVALAKANTLDCIVLDIDMPTVDGWEVMNMLRKEPDTAGLPVLVMTDGPPSDADCLRIIESGAVDHIAKPLAMPLLLAKVRAVADRARTQRELKNKLRFALENAAHDPLTGLFNRRYFERRLREEVAQARRYQRPFAIVMIDIDHFKLVNDTYGHADGDRVLRHLAEVVTASMREDDISCRYGGEEFVLLLRNTSGPAARVLANRLRATLAQRPIALGPDGQLRHMTFSAGVAAADERNTFDPTDIVSRADAALYRAKRGGRNRTEAE